MLDLAAADRLELSMDHATLLEERRGIPPEIAAQVGIVSHGKAIGFQYRRNGALRFTKFRGPDKKFWIEPSGVKLFLWNLDCCQHLISTGGTLVINEGEIDSASCIAAGFPCSVSVPNGAPQERGSGDVIPGEDTRFSYLWDEHGRLIPELGNAGKIILATDSDGPGQNLAAELALRLGPDRCFLAQYPKDCKDANEVLVKHGLEALRSALQTAIALVPDKLVDWDQLPPRTKADGLGTGWRTLDPHLKLTFPELIVVTGKPGAGKSRWALAWVMNLARLHGVRSSYVSLEDSADRLKRHTISYARAWEGSDVTDSHGEITTPIPNGEAAQWLKHHMRFISPSVGEEDTRDLEWLKRIIWEAACRHDCKIIVLDPWNELEHMWDRRGVGVDEYINQALRELKRLGRRYGITIVIIAHPDKAGGRNETIEEMTLYSISGGAAWKNKADGGIIIAQETNSEGSTGNSIVKIDKRKDWDTMGIPGTVVLKFDSARGLYSSL